MLNSGNNYREPNWLLLKSKGEESPVRLAGDCNPWMSRMNIIGSSDNTVDFVVPSDYDDVTPRMQTKNLRYDDVTPNDYNFQFNYMILLADILLLPCR
jgi:hypothetical protein